MVSQVSVEITPYDIFFRGEIQTAGLPLEYRGPFLWRAHPWDEQLLRAYLPGVEWPEPKPRTPLPEPDLGGLVLYDYQKKVLEMPKTFLLCDEPGLGKTIEALAYLKAFGAKKNLVLCRLSAIEQWRMEAERVGVPVEVRNYEALFQGEFDREWDSVILDEAHTIKEWNSKRTRKAHDLLGDIPIRIVMTGTPIRNHVRELWSLVRFVDKGRFEDWREFAIRYCGPTRVKRGYRTFEIFDGATHQEELNLRLAPIMLRRSREDVSLQIPPVVRTILPIKFSEPVQAEMRKRLEEYRADPNKLGSLSSLRQWFSVQKVEYAKDWLKGRKRTLVFSEYREVLEALREFGPVINGDTPKEERDAILAGYHQSPGILLLTVKTGGESLNLTDADTVLFIDYDWSPAVILQGEHRISRIGQERPIEVVIMVADGVDKMVATTVMEKLKTPLLDDSWKETLERILCR